MTGCVALIGLESLTKRGIAGPRGEFVTRYCECKSDEKRVSRLCNLRLPGGHQTAQTPNYHPAEHKQRGQLERKKADPREIDGRRERRQIAEANHEKDRREDPERSDRANAALQHA